MKNGAFHEERKVVNQFLASSVTIGCFTLVRPKGCLEKVRKSFILSKSQVTDLFPVKVVDRTVNSPTNSFLKKT